MSRIQSDPEWAWANYPAILGELVTTKEMLHSRLNTDMFIRDVMTTSDINIMKNDYKHDDLEFKLKKLHEVLSPLVSAVGKQCRLVLAQSRARKAVMGTGE